jgi:hypothetical protein
MDTPTDIYTVLGIDSSINIYTTDPVANKNSDDKFKVLYEKGNQLTVLALALTNISNDLKTETANTADFFDGIALELEAAYAIDNLTVDIESKAFITQVLNGLITAKSLEITSVALDNTINALTAIMPLIQVKSSSAVTRSILNFSLKNLQSDIVSIANGVASASLITSYSSDIKSFIASTEPVTSLELNPLVFAFDDNVTTDEDTAIAIAVGANDSLLSAVTATIGILTAPSNGTVTISGTTVTYTPSANFNGSDTFTYSVTQGDSTSSAVANISVAAINDAPAINSSLTIRGVSGSTAVTGISVSDVDGDTLTLSLDGADAGIFSLSSDGVLTFKTAPDFFVKSSYSVTIVASDGTLTTSQDITVSVFRAQITGFDVPETISVIETL